MRLKILLLSILLFLIIAENYSQVSSRPKEWAKPITSEYLQNFHQLNQEIYRSRQPNREGFKALKKMGIQSVLNLRTSFADKKLINGLSFHYYQVPMSPENITEDQLVDALKILKIAPKPILVHCVRGADRTGAVIAAYRIIFEAWSKEAALNEMIYGGFGFHDDYSNIPRLIRNLNDGAIREQLFQVKCFKKLKE